MATTPSGRKQQLAAVLRYLRDRKSIMQEAVGRRLRPAATVRSSQNKIAQLESGKQGISQEDLVALLGIYGVIDARSRWPERCAPGPRSPGAGASTALSTPSRCAATWSWRRTPS